MCVCVVQNYIVSGAASGGGDGTRLLKLYYSYGGGEGGGVIHFEARACVQV